MHALCEFAVLCSAALVGAIVCSCLQMLLRANLWLEVDFVLVNQSDNITLIVRCSCWRLSLTEYNCRVCFDRHVLHAHEQSFRVEFVVRGVYRDGYRLLCEVHGLTFCKVRDVFRADYVLCKRERSYLVCE